MSAKKFIAAFVACQLAVLPTLAQAQSSDFNHAFTRHGTEVRMSFTIPLGNSLDKRKTEPRLNLGVRNYTQTPTSSKDWMMRENLYAFNEVHLGFTIEETPQLMMNGQALILSEDEQANIGTAGKIGLGIGAVALAGVAVIAIAFIACYETGSDCDEEG